MDGIALQGTSRDMIENVCETNKYTPARTNEVPILKIGILVYYSLRVLFASKKKLCITRIIVLLK